MSQLLIGIFLMVIGTIAATLGGFMAKDGWQKINQPRTATASGQQTSNLNQQDQVPYVKIKINRLLDDLESGIKLSKDKYFKDSTTIASEMSARGVGRSGIHIKKQKERALGAKQDIEKLLQETSRGIEDLLFEKLNATTLNGMDNIVAPQN